MSAPTPAVPVVPDNVVERKVLVYGPHGEALIRQEPRRLGFRAPAPSSEIPEEDADKAPGSSDDAARWAGG